MSHSCVACSSAEDFLDGSSMRTPANGVLRDSTNAEHTINRLLTLSAIESLKGTPFITSASTSTG